MSHVKTFCRVGLKFLRAWTFKQPFCMSDKMNKATVFETGVAYHSLIIEDNKIHV